MNFAEFLRTPLLQATSSDITNMPYYKIEKYLSPVLQPLTRTSYTLKNSFDAVDKIKFVPLETLEEGHQFVSFNVESLVMNVPLDKTINTILERIYWQKLLKTNFKKRTIKKLLIDSCTKTAFFYDKIFSK